MRDWRSKDRGREHPSMNGRLAFLSLIFCIGLLIIIGRLFQLQVIEAKTYKLLASDQHEVQAQLVPRRGTIFLQDRYDRALHPFAKDREAWQVHVLKRQLEDATTTAAELGEILELPADGLLATMLSPSSSYAVLVKDATLEEAEKIRERRLSGIGVSQGLVRVYPEEGLGGQLFGFVSTDDNGKRTGKYGIEGAYNDILDGEYGSLLIEKDAAGRRVSIGNTDFKQAVQGADIVLTLDRTLQYEACRRISQAVAEFQADSGTVIVMDPHTGAIWAMCSAPDFEPENYGAVKSLSVLNNSAVYGEFEPGSIFKPITIAAGIEDGKINPRTTYDDPGEETIDDFTVRNSTKLAYGVQTMTQVLEKSLNLGTIFVQRLLGKERFKYFVEQFGFGQKTGIAIGPESDGDIRPLSRKGDIFAATASYGQGITATPIQMLAAYGVLANGGKLMKPYVIKEIIHEDGRREETKPEVVRQVISARTARLVSGMMVTVVESGHGKRAAVPGYFVAGKTGTAQIPNPNGRGYLPDATIGSFVGYAPSDNPSFVMLVKIDRPRTVQYAEASAAPVFGDLAKFILSSMHVETERPIVEIKPDPLPLLPVQTSTATGTH
ncbi:penicillin-binding protein 2 [Candidatus Uhrbacteria bacterium]|nr:penicillin-binding protein 2 [Candidatus Uhrbacteria bacterium]